MASAPLRVGIVGGSIAGCTLAAELDRIGAAVTVFERSRSVLDDRGAGISSSKAHLDRLKSRGLVDRDMPAVDRTRATRAFTTRGTEPEGRVVWEQPISTYGLSWGILYSNLRRRVPDASYRFGTAVVGVGVRPDGVTARSSEGDEVDVDLLVFADGYASFGRQLLFPDLGMEYASYVAWRGLLPEGHLTADRPATEMAMHDGGNCVVYYVPDADGHVDIGRRYLNWVWYQVIDDDDLADSLVDRDRRAQPTSLARGRARPEVVDRLHERARRVLRTRAAEVVEATPDPFLQVVYDVRVPTHHVGRCAIIGDAATIARPHTGSGAIKAAQEAIALAEALAQGDPIDDALESWNAAVGPASEALFAAGRALGRAMVTECRGWDGFDAAMAERWWAHASEGSYVYYADDARSRGGS